MSKKITKKKVVDHREIPSTKEYIKTLGNVYQEKGLLASIGYEVQSTLYSLGKRLGNLLDSEASYGPQSEGGGTWPRGSVGANEWNNQLHRHDKRRKERVNYILRGNEDNNLNTKLASIISMASLVLGAFFFSSNITGNVIKELSSNTTSFLGAGFFVISLITGFLAISNKNNPSKK